MLVVDLIVGRLLDDVAQVRIFKGENAMRLEQLLNPGKDRVDVRDVAHHIGAEKRVGRAVLSENRLRPAASSKKRQTVRIPLARATSATLADGSTAQVANAGLRKMSQHDPVVAAHLDHERIGLRADMLLLHPLGKPLEVQRPCAPR